MYTCVHCSIRVKLIHFFHMSKDQDSTSDEAPTGESTNPLGALEACHSLQCVYLCESQLCPLWSSSQKAWTLCHLTSPTVSLCYWAVKLYELNLCKLWKQCLAFCLIYISGDGKCWSHSWRLFEIVVVVYIQNYQKHLEFKYQWFNALIYAQNQNIYTYSRTEMINDKQKNTHRDFRFLPSEVNYWNSSLVDCHLVAYVIL